MANAETNTANANSGTPSRRIFFGENESGALEFVDRYWDRIICFGYVTDSIRIGEPAGWTVVYAKADSEVSLHPLSDSFDSPTMLPARARSKARSAG